MTTVEPFKTITTTNMYENVRVPMLRIDDYPIWRVKMWMFLEAQDVEYFDILDDGPFVPMRDAEDKASMLKDAKVKNLLRTSLDVMSTRVFSFTSTKSIWEAIEVRC